jgi:hypothetical protein
MDARYIYLNGGPTNGWASWTQPAGNRARGFIRESRKLGMVPFFVYYNVPSGAESYAGDLAHISDTDYMEAYYKDLRLSLTIARAEGGDDTVGFIFEPDFLGYMAQNHPVAPSKTKAAVSAAYSSGVLNTSRGDPRFPDTLTGLVQSVNYLTGKLAPNVEFGWQVNLWASPPSGPPLPSTGIIHLTDGATSPANFASRRKEIGAEAARIAGYYLEAGIGSHGADFVSIDKYGLDAGQQPGAASDPAHSTWFWNADHWNNYLAFVRALHRTSRLPVVLWQLPIGRVNGSQADSPYHASGRFPALPNGPKRYEDSAPSFFFGDTFEVSGQRLKHFSANAGGDPDVIVDGNHVTWNEHMREAGAAGVSLVLFGAGVGLSTDGVGSPPTDDYWWITKAQRYLKNPAPQRR